MATYSGALSIDVTNASVTDSSTATFTFDAESVGITKIKLIGVRAADAATYTPTTVLKRYNTTTSAYESLAITNQTFSAITGNAGLIEEFVTSNDAWSDLNMIDTRFQDRTSGTLNPEVVLLPGDRLELTITKSGGASAYSIPYSKTHIF